MLTGKKVRLRDKTLSDIEKDYKWHKDPGLSRLDATYPTPLTFDEYKSDYPRQLRNSKDGSRHTLAIETLEGEYIGNCACYDIDQVTGEAEVGIMIGECGYWDKGYGEDALSTLIDHIFSETGLRRLYLKTLESNRRAESCFKKCGFTPYVSLVRRSMGFVFMELTRKDWGKRQRQKSKMTEV